MTILRNLHNFAYKAKIVLVFLFRKLTSFIFSLLGFDVNPFKSINYRDLNEEILNINNQKIARLGKGFYVTANGLSSNIIYKNLILDFGLETSFIDNIERLSQMTRNTNVFCKINTVVNLDKAFVVCSSGETNFSHYLMDLSLLYYSLELKIKNIVIGHQKNSMIESLLLPFKDIFNIYYVDSSKRIAINQIYVVIQNTSDFSDFLRTNWFRSKLLNHLSSLSENESDKHERIYLTRRSATRRNIINLKEVEKLLFDYDFNFVDVSELKIQEQFNLLYKAKIVVGAHGQNLSAAFLIKSCVIIDLTNEFYFKYDSYHRNLFNCLNFNHIELVDRKNRFKDDILVNISELESNLKLTL